MQFRTAVYPALWVAAAGLALGSAPGKPGAPAAAGVKPGTADGRYMRLAIDAARKGVGTGGLPFGACIVRGGRVLAVAANSSKKTADPTAHAEMEAIRAACARIRGIDLSGSTLYATGEPCVMCFGACFWARIPRIVFGARIADIQRAGIRQLEIGDQDLKTAGKVAVELKGDFMRSENLALLQLWSRRGGPARAGERPGRRALREGSER